MVPGDDHDFLDIVTCSKLKQMDPGTFRQGKENKLRGKGSIIGVASSIEETCFAISAIHLQRSSADCWLSVEEGRASIIEPYEVLGESRGEVVDWDRVRTRRWNCKP